MYSYLKLICPFQGLVYVSLILFLKYIYFIFMQIFQFFFKFLLFVLYIFSHSLLFRKLPSDYSDCVIENLHLGLVYIKFNTFCFLTEVFIKFAFNAIIDTVEFKSTSVFVVFSNYSLYPFSHFLALQCIIFLNNSTYLFLLFFLSIVPRFTICTFILLWSTFK